MKLSVSNIAWGKNELKDLLYILKDNGCDGIEIAPSLIWGEPVNSTKLERENLKKEIEKSGLELVGFHSLLFSRPDLLLFKNEEIRHKTLIYLKDLISLCSDMGGKKLIFGSPRNRSRQNKNYKDCLNQVYEDFKALADYSKDKDIFFCVEPLGENYSDFIVSVSEGGEIVKKLNHSNFKLHLDTKTIFYTKEDSEQIVKKYGDLIEHVHVSDNDLNAPGSTNPKKEHLLIGQALKKIKYKKFISIEMRKKDKETLINSIDFIKETYIS